MEYQARTRRIIALYFLAGLAYVAFFISTTLLQSLHDELFLFILGVFLLAMAVIGILALQENNLVLLAGSSILFLFLLFFIIIDTMQWPVRWSDLDPSINWIQTGMFIGATLYGLGIFLEWKRRRTQFRLTQVTFETQEAFYIEYVKSSEMVYLSFSKNFIRRHHLPYARLKIQMKQYFMFVHESDWTNVMCFEDALSNKALMTSKYRIRFPRMKSFARVQIQGSFALDNRYFCLAVDVTVSEQQNEAIAALNHQRALMLDNMQLGIIEQEMILNSEGHLIDYRYLYVNRAFESITGWTSQAMVSKTMLEFAPHLEKERLPYYQRLLINSSPIEFETLLFPQNRWFKLISYRIDDRRFVTLYHDIDEIKRANLALEYQALHDRLTDLLNTSGLYQVLSTENVIQRAVCFFIDIRDFTLINDYYGIEIGETVLTNLSTRLKKYQGEGHMVSRFASEQFVVIFKNPTLQQLVLATREMNDMLYSVLELEQATVHVKASIGYAHYPDDTTDLKELITLASLAMQATMSSVHNEMIRYAPWMSDQLSRNINVANKLHHAISNELIQIYFQHIVDARTGRVIYLESLARWKDEQEGWIPPDQFLHVARESHLIDALDEYLIEKAVRNFALVVQQPDYAHVHLAINLAPTTLMRETYAHELNRLVIQYGLHAESIHIEVSEDTFIHNLELCNKAIQAFRNYGFRIAIDDFGSKYSSLSILELVNYDMIKIDGAFVTTLDSPRTREIIQMVVRVAQMGHKDVVIEKVENADQSAQLIQLNCNFQQGFLFHVPHPLLNIPSK